MTVCFRRAECPSSSGPRWGPSSVSVSFVTDILYCGHNGAASRVSSPNDGVASRLTEVWNCIPQSWTASPPADPKRVSTEVYHTSRIISRPRKGKLSTCQARQTSSATSIWPTSIVHAFVKISFALLSVAAAKRLLGTARTCPRTGHR